MVLRFRINNFDRQTLSPNQIIIIDLLSVALKESDALYAKDYNDHEEDIEKFITNYLNALIVECDKL